MSVVRGFGLNGKSFYTNISKPQSVWVTFTVAAADSAGLGVTSVKSNGYLNYLFMHTSTTPGVSAGVTNPNPPSGYALFSFTNTFNKFLGIGGWSCVAPATSTSTSSTTANSPFIITALGTATAAQWQAVGLPQGVTAAVGQSFIATASQSIGGSATVGVPGVSNVGGVSLVGDPTTFVSNSNVSQNGGAQVMLLLQDFAGAAVAPTASSIIRLQFLFDGSSVTVDGL